MTIIITVMEKTLQVNTAINPFELNLKENPIGLKGAVVDLK